MLTTSQHLSAEPVAGEAVSTPTKSARLNIRVISYLVDSIVLLGFILAFFALAGLVLWLSSGLGQEDPPDSAYYAFMGVLIGGTIIGWSIFNLALSLWRGQTTGQYIAGLRVVADDGRVLPARRTLLRWFALHPLLFHPLLIPVWALFAALTLTLTLNRFVLGVTLALLALCAVAPAAALIAVLLDRDDRALHDRVSGTMVISNGS